MTTELDSFAFKKLARINEHLQQTYGVQIESTDPSYLAMVEQHYRANAKHLVRAHGLMESLSRPDYTKSVIIAEAISMFLREISPARTKKRTTRKDRK